MSKLAHVTELSDGEFEQEVINSDIPVVLDFWAPWCGPCIAMGPVVDDVAGQLEGKIKAYKMNVDDNPTTATRYGVRSIPTIMVFKNGKVEEQIVGLVSKSKLLTVVEKVLNK